MRGCVRACVCDAPGSFESHSNVNSMVTQTKTNARVRRVRTTPVVLMTSCRILASVLPATQAPNVK